MRKYLFLMGLMLAPLGLAAQQDTAAPELAIGIPATGTLDAETLAENYIFRGSEGDTITITATTTSEELSLILFIAAPGGAIVAQDADLSTPAEAFITSFDLPENGTYLVTVMRGNGAAGEASGDYTLVLSGTLTPPPPEETTQLPPAAGITAQNVTLTEGGIEISLAWSAAVNMDIEVRDPVGGSVFSGNSPSPSGGSLAADVNQVCDEATSDTPTETISWPVGSVPAGSYEIIIYYTDVCQLGGPQQFSLTASVNGDDAQVIGGTLNPGQQYLANVTMESGSQWALNNGGVNAGLDIGQLLQLIGEAEPLEGNTASGTINRNRPGYDYTFEGTAGSAITLTMDATSGSLDTYLILLGPNGNEIARNDDRDDVTTNSTITTQLGQDGTYTIVATRFGQAIGGTEGDFTLTFEQGEATTAQVTPAPTAAGTPENIVTSVITPTASADGLPAGSIEVQLTWNTAADLQLLVRDPSGEAIYDDNLTSVSGGFLSEDGNARCEGESNPLSYIYWPAPLLPRNTFEVEVWYQNDCDDITPVTFTLTINVQGEEIFNQTQAIILNARYMTTFTIDNAGEATVGETGFFDMTDANSINFFPLLAEAEPMEYEDVISDQITLTEKVKVYSFEGISGDRIRISMVRTGGTLDTAVYLISPDNIPVAFNDDIVNANTGERDTNSLIAEYTLEQSGTFYILATHYGLQYGGTTGTFNLSLFPLSVAQ